MLAESFFARRPDPTTATDDSNRPATVLSTATLPTLQRALAERALDGWLLFDFQGTNPIAVDLLGLTGMITRRHVAFIPAEGAPTALIPAIEPWPWHRWPPEWKRRSYDGWAALEAALHQLIAGRRIAMEYSAGNAIPHLDRVPAGAVEMVRAAGAVVVSSADLVNVFYAVWSDDQLAAHQRTAETLASIAHGTLALAGTCAHSNSPITEHELRDRVVGELSAHGLVTDSLPIVAAGEHSADVHYAPAADRARPIVQGDVLLLDLWAKEPDGVYADQTWMATIGEPSTDVRDAWEAALAARDAAIALIRSCVVEGKPIRGIDVHHRARAVLTERGYGAYALGRAGHSIDQRHLHGAGPNLDAVESRDERALLPGTACSVEPGVYIPGAFGLRSEVNLYVGNREILITPRDYQRDLIVL
jgi:Xaa-Pro aminopeptidase